MNANDILKYGQLTVLRTIEGLPEEHWYTGGVCGVWSVKDIIAHLASYEQVLAELLATFQGDDPTPTLDLFRDPDGNFNDSQVALRKDMRSADVLAEFNGVHARVLALAAQLTPELCASTGTLPWYGAEYALDDFIVYSFYGHKREHSAQIAVFRDTVG